MAKDGGAKAGAEHLRRRRLLARRMGEGALILAAAKPAQKSRDLDYHPYFPERYLCYLTGFVEPESALLMLAKNGKIQSETLFCRPRDKKQEQWQGERAGLRRAQTATGIAAADIATLQEALEKTTRQCADIFYLPGADSDLDSTLCKLAAARRLQNRAGIVPLRALRDAAFYLDPMRARKDGGEIARLRRAAAVSADGMRAAMRRAKSAGNECEVEAALAACFRASAARHAFAPIVAAGKNACILHYTDNNRRIKNGDLLLTDTGAEVENYAGDISRTFPRSGIFSEAQAAAYDSVLAAQRRALSAIRPGARWGDIENIAARTLCEGLSALGVCKQTPKVVFSKKLYRRFYMHRLGHFIGLDVHDVGRLDEECKLQSGMALTVEPGLYFPSAADIPPPFRGMGIRIEDTVLVRPGGCDILTAAAPKTRAEIERWMRD